MRALAILLIILAPAAALAQATPSSPTYSVDARPFWDGIIWPVISVLGFALVAWIGKIAKDHLGVAAGQAVEDRLNKIMQDGLNTAQLQLAGSTLEQFNVQNEILAKALNFVSKHAAEDLKKAGVTEELLKERLNALLAPAVMAAHAQAGQPSVAAVATQVNPAIATQPVPILVDGAPK